MKIVTMEIQQAEDMTWSVLITNCNGLRVHITGMETRAIAIHQAREKKRELRREGLL